MQVIIISLRSVFSSGTDDVTYFALGTTLPTARYDALLIAWEAQNPFDSLSPNFGSSTYTGGGASTSQSDLQR